MQKYHILLEKKASRHLKKLSKDTRNRIIETLHTLQDEGFSIRLNIKNCEDTKTTTGFE